MSSITQSGIETQSDPLVTVTISGGPSECPRMHAICVRHSHLPELYGEGETTQEAAEDLLRQLLFESAYVDNNRQREVLERAIEEIRNFLNGPSQAAEADSMATISDKDSRIASLPLLWEGETTMKPGLTNLRFQKEPDSATGQKSHWSTAAFPRFEPRGVRFARPASCSAKNSGGVPAGQRTSGTISISIRRSRISRRSRDSRRRKDR